MTMTVDRVLRARGLPNRLKVIHAIHPHACRRSLVPPSPANWPLTTQRKHIATASNRLYLYPGPPPIACVAGRGGKSSRPKPHTIIRLNKRALASIKVLHR